MCFLCYRRRRPWSSTLTLVGGFRPAQRQIASQLDAAQNGEDTVFRQRYSRRPSEFARTLEITEQNVIRFSLPGILGTPTRTIHLPLTSSYPTRRPTVTALSPSPTLSSTPASRSGSTGRLSLAAGPGSPKSSSVTVGARLVTRRGPKATIVWVRNTRRLRSADNQRRRRRC